MHRAIDVAVTVMYVVWLSLRLVHSATKARYAALSRC